MNAIAAWHGTAAILLLTPWWMAEGSHLALSESQQTFRIHIRLVDQMGLPEKTLVYSELVVLSIFHNSGMDLDFVECQANGTSCRQPPTKGDYWLQILAQPPKNLHKDVTGFAVLVASGQPGDSYAAVSYPLVASAAATLDVAIEHVLGAAMAHEIGHLLLNTSDHSRTGIMSPRLDRRQIQLLERGELVFSKNQVGRIWKVANQFRP